MKWSTSSKKSALHTIQQQLEVLCGEHDSILLLISGGSAIELEAALLTQLSAKESILGVLPMDERYGDPGHPDSNVYQLLQELHTDPPVVVHDVLKHALPLDQTVDYYSSLAQDLFSRADMVVGIFGIGADGHTAGLLPDSPAITDTVSTVIGYSWDDYQRMTLGTSRLTEIDKAWVLAYGETKQNALERLQQNDEDSSKLPARLLYDLADVTIYNDYITNEG